MMDAMVQCNLGAVFLGVETPDTDSLALTKKSQNNRDPLAESVTHIAKSGLRVMAGFIIGFDNEKPGAGQRIVDFVEQRAVPTGAFSMLQALPDTGLYKRLAATGRLVGDGSGGDINQTTLMNFVPTRPMEQIAKEFVDGFWKLYDPKVYLDRVFRHFMLLKQATYPKKPKSAKKKLDKRYRRALATIMWRQGVVRETRFMFWRNLYRMYKLNPGGLSSYMTTCAQMEHFLVYRERVKQEITAQLNRRLAVHAEAATVVGKTVTAQGGDGRVILPVLSSGGPEAPVAGSGSHATVASAATSCGS